MGRKKKRSKKAADEDLDNLLEEGDETWLGMKRGTARSVVAIAFFVVAIFFALASIGGAGKAGVFLHAKVIMPLFGYGFILFIMICIMLGLMHVRGTNFTMGKRQWISAITLLVGTLGFLELIFKNHAGGILGMIAHPIVKLFDIYVGGVIFVAIIIISLLVFLEARLGIPEWWKRWRKGEEDTADEADVDEVTFTTNTPPTKEEREEIPEPTIPQKKNKLDEESLQIKEERQKLRSAYVPPPLSLLEEQKGKPGVGDIKGNALIIKRTLENFNVPVEMDEITIGPTVTRYTLKPAQGVKLTRILGLQNELALGLAVHPVRIEAPIPGTSLVGIEVPNRTKAVVGIRELIADGEFANGLKPLLSTLGKSVSGKCHYANIAKMPHLLIAGATGSGKSVMVHDLVVSLLYRNGPEDLRFIMVDPKRVELTLYNNIPHLLTPVIKDPKKAILALRWAAKEMERRYELLEEKSVRDIESYHKTIVYPAYKKKKAGDNEDGLPERMPYIVIIIDELADIMQSYPRELEAAVVRLAQMSRAVGIHLVLSTQRPSVNVITGLIKANIPARIALQVSSQIDSRTIIDSAGAEKLLGAGDLLYTSGDMAKPLRIQGAYVSEDEVKRVAQHIIEHNGGASLDDIALPETLGSDNAIFSASMDGSGDGDDDELFEDARQVVIEAGRASTSYLQRKLRVGYARAARLMDILEERGVVGPADGAKPREVLVERGEATKDIGDAPMPPEQEV